MKCVFTRDDLISDLYLVALYGDIYERHTIHNSKEQVFTFMMMLIFFRCFVLFNNYSTIQLLSKCFIDSDFCHIFFHTLYLFECL